MKIESTDQDIRTLLSSGYYKIPRFQRPYSWDRENIQEFWDDVVRDHSGEYFIGSMVVYKEQTQYFGVVDGQQRLTTITILLCVLRDTLSSLKFKNLADGIHGLVEKRNIDYKPEFILSTESSYPYFQEHIQKWGKPDVPITPHKEEENLQNAFDQFKELVNNIIDSAKTDPTLTVKKRKDLIKQKLINVRDSLLNLKLIFIKLDDEDEAYIIFETLNTRGKDLSLTDLVKNHLTKHLKAKSASVDQTKLKWEKYLEIIEGSSIELNSDSFLHHLWLSKYDFITARKLFKVLKKEVTKANASSLLDDIIKDSRLYRSIHETSYGKWSKQERRIEDALKALQLFRVQQQIPCVLSLVREYKSKKIQKKHIEAALVAIEKFHFFFTAITSQRSSGGISSMYASLGRRLFKAQNTHSAVTIIRDLKNKLKDRMPSLVEVKAILPEVIYTDSITKQKKLVKYILVAFHKANNQNVSIDYESMTIEHLVPQSMIGHGNYSESIIGQIGNLILVTESLNDKLKNKSFKDKKKIFNKEEYKLPDKLKSATNWKDSDIINRTQLLAETAYNDIWKI